MIECAGETLPAWEERIVREELEGGDRLPTRWRCDGCSGGCPDSFPPWRRVAERIMVRDGCAIHDAEDAYGGAGARVPIFPSCWHRAAARWEADRRLGRNWRRLPELAPYAERFAAWRPWERWAYRLATRVGFRGLRVLGWLAKADPGVPAG